MRVRASPWCAVPAWHTPPRTHAQSSRRVLMRLRGGLRWWGEARGAFFCEYVDEGHVRTGGACVRACAARAGVYALSMGDRFWGDWRRSGTISPLLCFGAFSPKDGKRRRKVEIGRKKNPLGGKIELKRKERRGRSAAGHIFTPLTRCDDCCFALFPPPLYLSRHFSNPFACQSSGGRSRLVWDDITM